jgi:hypothetical protein
MAAPPSCLDRVAHQAVLAHNLTTHTQVQPEPRGCVPTFASQPVNIRFVGRAEKSLVIGQWRRWYTAYSVSSSSLLRLVCVAAPRNSSVPRHCRSPPCHLMPNHAARFSQLYEQLPDSPSAASRGATPPFCLPWSRKSDNVCVLWASAWRLIPPLCPSLATVHSLADGPSSSHMLPIYYAVCSVCAL